MKPDGVDTAYGLLSDILSEITLNDLPPTNENPATQISSPRISSQVVSTKGIIASSNRYGSTKYSRQIHKSSDASSPATAHTSPITPTNSTPSSVSPRYRNLAISPSTGSSFSTSSNFSIGKSGSFEDMAPQFISPGEGEAYSKAKSISTMGNSSLATYMYNTLNRSYEFRTVNEHEQFQQSMEVLQRLQNTSNTSSNPHVNGGGTDHHNMIHPTSSKQRSRLNSKSTYSPTTSGQTSESGSHASISSKNSLSLGEMWTNDKVDTLANDLRNLTVNTMGEYGGDSTEDYDYHHEAIMNDNGDVYLSEESEDEEASDKKTVSNPNCNSETFNTPTKKETDISSQPTPLMGLNLSKDPKMKPSMKATNMNSLHMNPPSEVNANKRIQMFGSEYARFLSSTVLSPAIPRKKKSIMQSLSRIKENKTPQKSNTTTNLGSLPPSSSSNVHYRSRFLEDAPHAVLTGPVTDMVITLGNELPPRGFYRISLSANGHKADLTNNSGGTSLFLNVKKESNWDRAAQRPSVTAMAVIFPDRGEIVPPGFCFVRRIKEKRMNKRNKHTDSKSMASQSFRAAQDAAVPANLNFGTNGERVYLCFKKSREGNPITGIIPLLPGKLEAIPDGFTVLERSPRNFVADINSGAGPPIFLAYRQRLTNLETLRPKPLLQIHSQKLLDPSETLNGYFCTGGTVIKGKVGDLHIMDRSTHTMLSPSSVTNRLALIHQSRDGTEGFDVVKLQQKKPRRRTSPAPPKATKRYSPSPTPSTKSNTSYNVSFMDGNVEMADMDLAENTEYVSNRRNLRTLSWKEFKSPNGDENGNLVAFDFIPFVTDGTGDILCEPARIEVITPILTACYTQHGGSAVLAVEGLLKLLNESDFFEEDVREGDRDEHCLTLLDLSVQVVCDVATSSSRETHFKPCVDFVSGAIRFAKGNLGPRTFGYALRFYLFVFYFGANVAPSSCWPHSIRLEDYSRKGSKKNFDVDVPLLSEIDDPGVGAPQSSALFLKEMVTLVLQRLGENPMIDEDALISEKKKEDNIHDFVENLILGMISNSAKRVDVNNITELAIHQIHRSGGSELFWYDMVSSCGYELFGDNATYALAFGILANLVKVGSGYMRRVKETQELVPRDVSTKLLTLEMVLHFLDRASISIGDRVEASSDHHRSSNDLNYTNTKQQQDKKVLSYTIRRLVVPLVLSNTTAGLEDPRVFRRLLKIVAKLWSCFRTHLKVEIAVLFEHFLLRVLRLGPKVLAFSNRNPMDQMNHRIYLDHQLDVLSEVELWVENPIDLLELFLNYDMGDASSATHWKACQHICGALCKLAEQCGEIIADQINSSRVNNETNSANASVSIINQVEGVEELAQTRDAARSLQEKSLDVICHLVRLIMEASHRAYTKQKRKDYPVGRRILSDGSWESNESLLNSDIAPYGLHAYQSIEPENLNDYTDDMSDASYSSADTSPSPMRKPKKTSPTRKRMASNPISPQRVARFDPSISATKNEKNRLNPPVVEKPPRHPPIFRSPLKLMRHKSKVDELTEDQRRTQEALQVAFEIIETKNNGLKKGLDYLIACNFLLPGPRDAASFLRIHKQRIDPVVLGEYLGEGGHAGDGEYWKLVRYHYIRATSFVGMNVEYG